MAEYISGQHYQVLERIHSGNAFNGDTFRQLMLDGTYLNEATFQHCQIERCGFAGSQFERSRLDDTRVSNTSLRAINGTRSAWVEARVRLCDMAGAVLTGAILNGCRFDETLMAGVDFNGATLTGCEFDLCDLMGASFNGALIVRSKFRDARLGTANLMSTSFEGAQLVDLDLRDANLQYANLSGAILVRVHLLGANLQGANLEGVSLVECQGASDELLERARESAYPRMRVGEAPLARSVDVALEGHLERIGPAGLGRLSRELLRTYVIEGSGALMSEDRAAALLRQRNLSFADLMRFVKERFPHEELNQLLVEGDGVFMRTPAGDVPLTRYQGPGGGGGRAGAAPQVTSSRPSVSTMSNANIANANSGMGNSGMGNSSGNNQSMRSAPPVPVPGVSVIPSGMPTPSAPAVMGGTRNTVPDPPRPAPPPPPPPPPPQPMRNQADDDAFEPDRFGMIDL